MIDSLFFTFLKKEFSSSFNEPLFSNNLIDKFITNYLSTNKDSSYPSSQVINKDLYTKDFFLDLLTHYLKDNKILFISYSLYDLPFFIILPPNSINTKINF